MSVDVGFLVEASIKTIIIFHFVLIVVAYTVLAERRVLAFIQNRLGPNRVGPQGLLQPFADLLKFIFKEDLVPLAVNKGLYLFAPFMTLVPALMVMIVYPFGPTVNIPFIGAVDLYVTRLNIGLLLCLCAHESRCLRDCACRMVVKFKVQPSWRIELIGTDGEL